MDIETHPFGTVCWVDLGTRDPDATAAFYTALFGWTVLDPDEEGYRICLLRDRAVAGLGPSSSSEAPYWTTNILVEDVAAAASAFTVAGGEVVVAPACGGDLGSFAVVRDPGGAPVSLWQPGAAGSMGLSVETGAFSRARLFSTSSQSAADFYAEVFGWRTRSWPGGADVLLEDGTVVASICEWPSTAGGGRPSQWLVSFAVDDVDAAAARAHEIGARAADADTYGPGYLVDPAGAVLGLTSAYDG